MFPFKLTSDSVSKYIFAIRVTDMLEPILPHFIAIN